MYLFFLCLAVVWSVGFIRFVNLVSNYSSLDQKINTEAIVVLTGGQKRIEEGIFLLKENPSKKLFITGIDSRIKKIPVVINIPNLLSKNMQNKVEFGQKATSTFENALEAKEWLKKNKIKSITLVTASYHMPRSLLEFKDAMPNIRIECYSVFPKGFRNKLWQNPMRTIFLLKEYTKYSIVATKIYIKNFYGKLI